MKCDKFDQCKHRFEPWFCMICKWNKNFQDCFKLDEMVDVYYCKECKQKVLKGVDFCSLTCESIHKLKERGEYEDEKKMIINFKDFPYEKFDLNVLKECYERQDELFLSILGREFKCKVILIRDKDFTLKLDEEFIDMNYEKYEMIGIDIIKEIEEIFYKRFSKEGMKKAYSESNGDPHYKYLYYDLQDDLFNLINKMKRNGKK